MICLKSELSLQERYGGFSLRAAWWEGWYPIINRRQWGALVGMRGSVNSGHSVSLALENRDRGKALFEVWDYCESQMVRFLDLLEDEN
jgi:hypothetical protein